MVVGPRDSQGDRPTAPLTYSHNAESGGDSVEPLGYGPDRVDERRIGRLGIRIKLVKRVFRRHAQLTLKERPVNQQVLRLVRGGVEEFSRVQLGVHFLEMLRKQAGVNVLEIHSAAAT
jgi:hypothetical protein